MQPSEAIAGYFTERFERALVYSARLHNRQSRKGTQIPYAAHLLAVTALVIEWGGDEDQAIAALLHDSVEDQGGEVTLRQIREQFGDRVARIVEACSDSVINPKPPWRERKEAYLRRLRSEPEDVRLVSLADKLHNARSIYMDLQIHGCSILERFRGGRQGTLWYYRALVAVFKETDNHVWVDEFARVVAGIELLAGQD
jgi:GTP pyrophosphokinase